jgi:hypothetical protein
MPTSLNERLVILANQIAECYAVRASVVARDPQELVEFNRLSAEARKMREKSKQWRANPVTK